MQNEIHRSLNESSPGWPGLLPRLHRMRIRDTWTCGGSGSNIRARTQEGSETKIASH